MERSAVNLGSSESIDVSIPVFQLACNTKSEIYYVKTP
jgi:hypothetical protein